MQRQGLQDRMEHEFKRDLRRHLCRIQRPDSARYRHIRRANVRLGTLWDLAHFTLDDPDTSVTSSTTTSLPIRPQPAQNSQFTQQNRQPVPSFQQQQWSHTDPVVYQEGFHHQHFNNPEPLATEPIHTRIAPQSSGPNFEDVHSQYYQSAQPSTGPQVHTTTVQEQAYTPPPLSTWRPDDYQHRLPNEQQFQQPHIVEIQRPRPPSPSHDRREPPRRHHSSTRSRSRSVSQNRDFIYASPTDSRRDIDEPFHSPIIHNQEQEHPMSDGHHSYNDHLQQHNLPQPRSSSIHQDPHFFREPSRLQTSQASEHNYSTSSYDTPIHLHPSQNRQSTVAEANLVDQSLRSQSSMANGQVNSLSIRNSENNHTSHHGSVHSRSSSKSRDRVSRSEVDPPSVRRRPVERDNYYPPNARDRFQERHHDRERTPSSRSSSATRDTGRDSGFVEGPISGQTSEVIDCGSSTRSRRSSDRSYHTRRGSTTESVIEQWQRCQSKYHSAEGGRPDADGCTAPGNHSRERREHRQRR